MSNSDSELEEDEEEILVYVEFDNCATNDVFSSENLKLDMLGLDSDRPVMQVNGKFFEGTYEDAVGTYMFFEKDDNPAIDDQVFDKIPTLKYFHKTRKLLKMQRAFVTPRHEVVGDSEHRKCIPNMDTIKEAGVPPKYQEEAFAFWNESRCNRINALNEYLRKQEFRKGLRARGFEPESESDEDHPFAMYIGEESETSKDIGTGDNSDFNSQIKILENSLQMTEINKENEYSQRKLNVIDPGPSTSKNSMPWIDDDVPKVPEKQKISEKVKSIGRVRAKTTKGRVQKKTGKKKKVSAVSVSEKLFKDPFENQPSESTIAPANGTSKNDDTNAEIIESDLNSESLQHNVVEEMDIDEINAEESDRLLAEELNIENPIISEKEKRKREKREAKMREISEKLKAISQTSSKPAFS